jgi:predicted transcriptional regulator
MPFEAVLFEATLPAYRRIAREANQLRALGLSLSTIGTELGVSDKTVAKALAAVKLTRDE